jgi:hypothetical protein
MQNVGSVTAPGWRAHAAHARARLTPRTPTPDRIKAWLDHDDENPILDVDTTGVEIGTRADIDAARPLGLSTFQTSAAYKNITLKKF